MAEQDVFDDDGDLDIESLLRYLDAVPPDDFVLDLDAKPPPDPSPAATDEPSTIPTETGSPDEPNSSWASEIEKFLLDDGNGEECGGVPEGFQNDFFADVLRPESGNGEESEKEKKDECSADGDVDEEDAISKKRRRQIRNRDSAVKSRERKKLYIKDLEKKSKYLEIECRRLDHAFRCCVAENIALRQCLQNGRALGAPSARQESAVLFVESLLLGSLFWLVSVICLFLAPGLPSLKQNNASILGRGLAQVGALKITTNRSIGSQLGSSFIGFRRRCRGMRSRMKSSFVPLGCCFSVI